MTLDDPTANLTTQTLNGITIGYLSYTEDDQRPADARRTANTA